MLRPYADKPAAPPAPLAQSAARRRSCEHSASFFANPVGQEWLHLACRKRHEMVAVLTLRYRQYAAFGCEARLGKLGRQFEKITQRRPASHDRRAAPHRRVNQRRSKNSLPRDEERGLGEIVFIGDA